MAYGTLPAFDRSLEHTVLVYPSTAVDFDMRRIDEVEFAALAQAVQFTNSIKATYSSTNLLLEPQTGE